MKGTLFVIGEREHPCQNLDTSSGSFGFLSHPGLFFPFKTTYTTLWALYHLARNSEIQEILYQEIFGILGKDGDVTAGSLAKLSYLKACVKESARQVHVLRWILSESVV